MVVYALERDGPVTAARIAALARRPAEAVRRDLNALAALGLVKRTCIPRGPGRGWTWRLAPENPDLAHLLTTLARTVRFHDQRDGVARDHHNQKGTHNS
ncbi:MAG TPA: hypothetical protein VF744_12485 [Beijerinckiaceae bacterium]|jgi:predicted ArsR family transcriptional regulator